MLKLVWWTLRICVAMLGVILAGCAASGPPFEPVTVIPEKALVYLFREPKLVASGYSYTISANGKSVTELPNGGYFPLDHDPGPIEFRAVHGLGLPLLLSAIDRELMKEKVLLTLHVEMGGTYYVKLEPGFGKLTMESVGKWNAAEALKDLNRAEDLRDQAQ